MTRTTPPRPLDVVSLFPELAGRARTATRLHPRPGAPTVHDSSVGGPLLWPAGEDWPVCTGTHRPYELTTLRDVRTRRRVLAQAWQRPRPPRTNLLTPDEQAVIDRISAGYDLALLPAEPQPLIPLAQLYARDVPGLPCPDGMDLLQVLWCPFDEIMDSGAEVRLRWRRSGTVTDVPADPPEPAYIGNGDYVPEPCVLHPERVVEYPAYHDLPEELAERVIARERELLASPAPDQPRYQGNLSVAPGWKVGGWAAFFTFRDPADPDELRCCGAPLEPLLTIADEWDPDSITWRPADEEGSTENNPTRVVIGRGYTLQVYRCTASSAHAPVTVMQ
ncbi:hypothetical protein ACFQFC_08520 [Amorphoplanes digitatis]|uniref:Uncharacterized protein n=1 Tax=Actinoplanes digitatis TaxID=1868 RepID=A0A7W7I0S9_9ACTN|nr:hypothetical protein [Actinoplanes digitatis]MBB4764250.1 hypothetical protein [Actinoplanes digitatis]GID96358.1 hypothetical protein Adi01nite_57700 [Actinoplanes digitatis]